MLGKNQTTKFIQIDSGFQPDKGIPFFLCQLKSRTLFLFMLLFGCLMNLKGVPTVCEDLLEQLQQNLKLSQLEEAGPLLDRFSESIDCSEQESWTLLVLKGDYQRMSGENEAALILYEQILAESSVASQTRIQALIGTAKIQLALLNFAKVEESLQQLRQMTELQTETSALIYGKIKYLEGRLATVRRRDEEGVQHFRLAIDFFADPVEGDSADLVRSWVSIAYNFIQLFELDSAEKYLTNSFKWQKKHRPEDHLDVALTYLYLGQLNFRRKDHGRAEEYFKASLRIRQKILGEGHSDIAYVQSMLGLCYYRRGNFDQSIASLEEALASFENVYGKNHNMVGSTNLNLGMVRVESEQYQAAIGNFLSALRIWKQLFGESSRQVLSIYNNLGMSYLRLDQHKNAQEAFEKAYELVVEKYPTYHPYPARIASNLGRTHRALLQFPEALSWHQQALGHLVPDLDTDPYASLPSLQGPIAGELVEALRLKGETILFKNEGPDPNKKEVETALAIFTQTNDLIDSLRLGFREESSKLSYSRQAKSTYEGGLAAASILYHMTGESRYMDQAFEFSERSKSLVLLEALQLDEAVAFDEVPDEIRFRETELRLQMADYQQELYELAKNGPATASDQKLELERAQFLARQSYDSLIRVLERNYPAYFRHKYDLKVASIEETRHLLPDSTAWLEFFVGDKDMHLFCLTADSLIWLKQAITGDLSERIKQFRESIYSPFFQGKMPGPEQEYEQHGHNLYQELLAPLMDRFPGLPTKWIVVVDGALGYVPFDALLLKVPEQTGKYKSYPYLGKSYQISYTYSATLLKQLLSGASDQRSASRSIAFAPVFSREGEEQLKGEALRAGLGPLPFSKKEVKEIGKLIQCKTFLQSEANRENFLKLAPDSRLIHLSTHAKVNDLQAELSCVIFAGPDSLTAHEIAAMDLQAELVVLSACETGLGKLYEGEGILSLARGFTYAGSQSLLTTLWRVNDATTAGIMGDFYTQLAAGLPKGDALHFAKQNHLDQQDHLLAHPFYWAGYTLMGNTGPISDLDRSVDLIWYVILILIGSALTFAMVRSQIQYKRNS